jgi:hypothetical protein
MAVKEGLINIFPKSGHIRLKYKDIFDMKEFYCAIYEWLEENAWADAAGNSNHWETFYKERVGQGGAKEIWIQWRPSRAAEGAPLTYYLDFNFHCVALMKTEVIKEGRKMKVNKGEVELVIKAFIEKNYERDFKSDSILKHILKLFNNRIYNKTIEQRRKELYQETYALQNFIKQWLKLKRYLPYEESKNFFPSYAWPSHLKE